MWIINVTKHNMQRYDQSVARLVTRDRNLYSNVKRQNRVIIYASVTWLMTQIVYYVINLEQTWLYMNELRQQFVRHICNESGIGAKRPIYVSSPTYVNSRHYVTSLAYMQRVRYNYVSSPAYM